MKAQFPLWKREEKSKPADTRSGTYRSADSSNTMVGNPHWPPDDDGNERRLLRALLVCVFVLFALTIVQFAIGLLVALGFRIHAG